ncbi:MAG: hypothetical protein EA426_18360, partial [Spirochaetaceae bacterium]
MGRRERLYHVAVGFSIRLVRAAFRVYDQKRADQNNPRSGKMTSRERARKILNHLEADRPAIDLGATRMSGTSAWSYRALKKELGIASDRVRVFDLYQMLAEVEEPVLDAIGADFVMLPIEELPMNLPNGEWEEFTFWDGQTFDVPRGFSPRVDDDGSLEAEWDRGDDAPYRMRMPNGGRYFDRVPETQTDLFDAPLKRKSEWSFGRYTDEFLRREQTRAQALYESSERAIVASPTLGAPQGYGDIYSWAIKMSTEPEHCRDYMMTAAEARERSMAEYVQAVGPYVDVINISGADYGTQDREVFRPSLFGEFYTPAWKRVCDAIHRGCDAKVWMHCCGSVPNMIPFFIEAGVDCLNPVQWTAAGMDLRTLKDSFGDKLVFWGGACSSQRTLPFGTADDVARETADVLSIMAPGGGYVANGIHNILAEVPPENIVAMYRTAREYR